MKKIIALIILLLTVVALYAQDTVSIADLPTTDSLGSTDLIIVDQTDSTRGITHIDFFKNSINIITPEMYGAVGDSSTNDYTALNNTFQASDLSNLLFHDKYYVCNSPIYLTKGQSEKMVIDGHGATIDFSGYNGNNACITIEGNVGDNYVLASAASKGDLYIVSTLVDEVSKGDILELNSDAFESPSHSFYPGEFISVSATDDTAIYFTEPLNSNYTTSDSVRLCYMADLEIKNLKLIYDDNDTYTTRGLLVRWFKNINIENVQTVGFPGAGMAVYYCYGGKIDNCYAYLNDKAGAGYGIDLSSCMYVDINNSQFFASRHGATISAVTWPSRYITVNGCKLSVISPWTYALDTHTGSEYITIDNNDIFGGINIRGPNVSITNNRIHNNSTGDFAIALTNGSGINCDYYKIQRNTVFGANFYGTAYTPSRDNDTIIDFNYNDNVLNVGALGIRIMGDPSNDTMDGCFIERLNIINTQITGTAGGTNYWPIILSGRIGYDQVNIIGGSISASASRGIMMTSGSSTGNVLKIENVNIVSGGTATNGRCIDLRYNNFSDVYLRTNYLTTNTNNTAIYIDSASTVYVDKNLINRSANDGLYVGSTVDSLFYNKNIRVNCTGTESLNATFEEFDWNQEKSSYYTKTNIQTSGESSVHWDNITNYSFAPYTVSSDSIHINFSDVPILYKYSSSIPANGSDGDTVFIRLYRDITDGTTPTIADVRCIQSRNGAISSTREVNVNMVSAYTSNNAVTKTEIGLIGASISTPNVTVGNYASGWVEIRYVTTASVTSTIWFYFWGMSNVTDISIYNQ